MSQLFASAINGAADGVRLGTSIRDRRDAAVSAKNAALWRENANNWKVEAGKWRDLYFTAQDDFINTLDEYTELVHRYNDLFAKAKEWEEYAANIKGKMKKAYSMWVGSEYDRDNAYIMIEKMSGIIRELDPHNQQFDNPNKVGIDVQKMSIELLRQAIKKYLDEVEEGTPFSFQFTEEKLSNEITEREERIQQHQQAVDNQDFKIKMF